MDFQRLIATDRQKLVDIYVEALESVKQQVRDDLLFKLMAYEPTAEALALYPWIGDVTKLVDNYLDCIVVESSPSARLLSLVLDGDKLEAYGLPHNLSSLLEWGNQTIPPFPHFSNIVDRLFATVKQRVK